MYGARLIQLSDTKAINALLARGLDLHMTNIDGQTVAELLDKIDHKRDN